jgi:hypothetical protein
MQPLTDHFFMLLLILLLGPCTINALSRFSTGPVDQTPALGQEILTSAYTWALQTILLGTIGDYTSQPLRQVLLPLSPPLPHCQHEVARWVTAPLPNSSWVLVSEGGFIGSDDLRQINGYSIPPEKPYHSYILRSYRPTFLHPEREL